jgi:hypothetical protein
MDNAKCTLSSLILIPYLNHKDFHSDIMRSHHSSRRHVQARSFRLFLLVFALVFAESHGAFLSSPVITAITTKSVRLSPTLFQATESENQDKEEASALVATLMTENNKKPPPSSNLVFKKETSIVDGLQTSFRIMRESQAQGYSITQIMANVLAGDYDEKAINAKIDNYIQQSPIKSRLCDSMIRGVREIQCELKLENVSDVLRFQ